MRHVYNFLIITIISFFIFPVETVFSQNNSDYTLVKQISKKANFITMDKLGNIYACDGISIDKYDEQGNLLFTYSALSTGRISFIDVYNPLKILVFSRDFMRLIFLDHKLAAQQGAYILSDLNIFPTHVCTSYDNGFWVYDETVKQLFRYDAQHNLTNKSQNITYFTEKDINPSFIKESEAGYVLINDIENGILIFDRFGTYLKTIPIFTDYFFIMNQQILYVENDTLKTIHIENLQQINILLNEKDIKQLCIENKRMAVLTKDNILKIYTIE